MEGHITYLVRYCHLGISYTFMYCTYKHCEHIVCIYGTAQRQERRQEILKPSSVSTN